MGNESAGSRKRMAEFEKLHEEGGRPLEARLKAGAREAIEDAWTEMDSAAQEVGKALVRACRAGMSIKEIQGLLDELADDAESSAGRFPVGVRMNIENVPGTLQASA